MKHLNILKILLERKKFLFLVLFIIIGLQLCWSFFRSRSLGVRPTPETWTFYHLDQRALDRNSNTFLWKLSDKDDDNDWKKVFDPETFDYDVHLEISGDRKSPDTRMTSKSNLNLSTEVIPNGLNSTATSPKLAVPFTPLVPIGDMDGLLLDEATNFATPGLLNIAIGSGLTTAKLLDLTESNLHEKMQLFKSFLPSFCQTASIEVDGRSRFNYHFYFAYDYTDKVLDGLVRGGGFYRVFKWVMDKFCPKGLLSFLHFVQCDHTHRPAWAQNDAMIEAYLDNVDYFYRINDDTLMKSKNWTETFVEVLNRYDPPNVGVVGPSHSGGNTAILTYDFVHKTHLDVFGFYYPRLFTDWWGDDWVTKVYLPHRMTKVRSIFLQHTLALGQRYSVKDWGVSKKLGDQLIRDRITLERYIRLRRKIKDGDLKPVPSRVISMSLYSSKPRHIWGAIRNAQLARILFPTWKLRFYVSRQSLNSNPPSNNNVDLHDHMTNDTKVSRRILKRLRLLGAEIKLVNDQAVKKVQPMNWRNLAIMDDDVEWVLMRNVDSRLTESEANGVERWIDNFKRRLNIDSQLLSLDTIAHFLSSFVGIYNPDQKKPAALHVIRDLPNSVSDAFPAGLWGGNAHLLRLLLEDTLQSIHQVSSEIPSGNVTSNSGNSVEIQSKIKSLNIDNPYLNPGLEELVRTWSTKPNESKMNSSYLGRLAKRLMVERLDYITCNGELDPKLQSHFAGQRFDEHEWPYLDNDVNVKTAYPNLGAVSPSLLCKTIDNVIVHYTTQAANTTVRTPSKGMPTRTNYGTNTTLSLKKIAS